MIWIFYPLGVVICGTHDVGQVLPTTFQQPTASNWLIYSLVTSSCPGNRVFHEARAGFKHSCYRLQIVLFTAENVLDWLYNSSSMLFNEISSTPRKSGALKYLTLNTRTKPQSLTPRRHIGLGKHLHFLNSFLFHEEKKFKISRNLKASYFHPLSQQRPGNVRLKSRKKRRTVRCLGDVCCALFNHSR